MDEINQTSIEYPVAERRYRVVGEPAREIVLEIGRPFLDPDPTGDWMCPYILHGMEGAAVKFVHGIDGVQALLGAMRSARSDLEAAEFLVAFEEGEPGDTGMPSMSMYCFGLEFAQKMEAMVDAEIQDMVDAKIKRNVDGGG
jgi:hypothetical protein